MDFEKYSRQIILPQIGILGQEKIQSAHIVVVGAGGIGCPLLLYLAAAGIGKITVIDFDIISESNLHRQILFSHSDIGKNKALTAADRIKRIHPECDIVGIPASMDTPLAHKIVADCDMVIDGSDAFLTKYILSDVVQHHYKPLIAASVVGFDGYVCGFYQNATYRDIFPMPPQNAPRCESVGVLGSAAGYTAMIISTEVIKHIVDMPNTIMNKIVRFSLLDMRLNMMDFSNHIPSQSPPMNDIIFVSDGTDLSGYDMIDVRNDDEVKNSPVFSESYTRIPISEFLKNPILPASIKNPLFMCHSGRRAQSAALQYALHHKKNALKISIFM